MAAGKSMTWFYVTMGAVAVLGVALIASGALKKAPPPLTLDTVGPLAQGPRGVVIGSDSAKVEVWEFSDFECPYCARFSILSMPDIRSRLVETWRVRWRFVHYPLQGHTSRRRRTSRRRVRTSRSGSGRCTTSCTRARTPGPRPATSAGRSARPRSVPAWTWSATMRA